MTERVSVADASRILRKSATQIRRQMRDGSLPSEREQLPGGGVRVWVLLHELPETPPPPAPPAPAMQLADHSPHELAALQLAAHAQEQASQLTEVVAQLTAQLTDAAQDRRALEIEVTMLRIQLEVAKAPAPAAAPMAHHGALSGRPRRGLPDWLARRWGRPGGELA